MDIRVEKLPSLGTLVLGVPLVPSTVVLVVHALHVLLGMTLGFDSVVFVHTLGFNELVDFGTDEADESLFGECVGDWLACGESVSQLPFLLISSWKRLEVG